MIEDELCRPLCLVGAQRQHRLRQARALALCINGHDRLVAQRRGNRCPVGGNALRKTCRFGGARRQHDVVERLAVDTPLRVLQAQAVDPSSKPDRCA